MPGYGWVPQRADHRDRQYTLEESILAAHQVPDTATIPMSAQPPIWNQLTIGSCTAHGSLRTFLIEAIKQGLSFPMLSRLMQYYDSRAVEGNADYDAGAVVRDAIKVLATVGCAPESEWPYDVSKLTEKPPVECYADAKKYMSVKYQAITLGGPGAPMRTAIASGNAICFGFPVPISFEDGSWDPPSGEPLPLPGPDEGYLGGHCVAATAYVFKGTSVSTPTTFRAFRPYFTCANSWDTTWGMDGLFNIDAEWFNPQRQLASDLWVIQADK